MKTAMKRKQRFRNGLIVFTIIVLCLIPWKSSSRNVYLASAPPIETSGVITLNPYLYQGNLDEIQLGINSPSDTDYQNTSFEYLIFTEDKFSYVDGYRPFPWGGEVFQSKVIFRSNLDSYSGKYSFEIIGLDKESVGVLAVPDIELKPRVVPGQVYYLSFWIKYNIQEGLGIRLIQQFFTKSDYSNPTYVCYGPWLKLKKGQEQWINIGMLVQAPKDAWKGDPVIELVGKGYLQVDNAYFGKVVIEK